MARTDSSGKQPITNLAPDGQPYSDTNYPHDWPQKDREKGLYRHPEGGRSFETFLATGNSDGSQIGAATESVLEDILYELRAMRLGMMASGLIEEVKDVDIRVLR